MATNGPSASVTMPRYVGITMSITDEGLSLHEYVRKHGSGHDKIVPDLRSIGLLLRARNHLHGLIRAAGSNESRLPGATPAIHFHVILEREGKIFHPEHRERLHRRKPE